MVGIWGTGRYLPEGILTNTDLEKMVETSDEWIVSRTGIRERHIARGETSTDIALKAAQNALEQAGVQPADLGLIICATMTPDHLSPSLSCELLARLGAQCPAFDLSAACSGFIFALGTAQKMMADKPVLVVGCEVLSRMVDWTERSTCVLFGDGAGAVVLGPGKGHELRAVELMSYADEKKSISIDGINRQEDGNIASSYLHMDGQEVYKFATRTLVSDIRELLSANGLSPADVQWFVPHQANLRIIQMASTMLKVPLERFFMNIEHTGNTSCASVAIALDELARSGEIHEGDCVVLSAFGGGLTSAGALLRW